MKLIMMKVMRTFVGLILFCFCLAVFGQSPENTLPPTPREIQQIEKHGTCATTESTDSKIAFVIDSRITLISGETFVGFQEGCKVALVRPTILVAATGMEDEVLRGSNHWNSLLEAEKALSSLPENPTKQQLLDWGTAWAKTLWAHYEASGVRPQNTGDVAQLLLMTVVDGQTFIVRPTVTWNGALFGRRIDSPALGEVAINYYSGYCRKFVSTAGEFNERVPREIPLTAQELKALDDIGDARYRAKSIYQLANVAMRNELEFAKIDARINGRFGVIGGPYATAEWDGESKVWKTEFNPACSANAVASH